MPVLAAATNATHGLHQMVLLFAAAFILIYAGVVLPAVWSTKPARRAAASAVLQQILDLLHRPS
jgi:hypothetical protein